ncbi:MAG: SDR family NAD(P)-dependent oxidoreductase [Gammaproteobacteria bacterium]|nr:SDR family NAD(P)-dependent oxidoreductase [Gammaproteobacteria bacterium]
MGCGPPIDAAGCTALVTGANQGIGRGFVEVLLERGAERVYATARRAETLPELAALDPERVVTLQLDVTHDAQRRAAAAAAADTVLLINNAGIPGSPIQAERCMLAASSLEDARLVMETDCWAQVEMCRLFAPLIVANGGGAICNIISIGALFCLPEFSSYSMAKAALATATSGIRAELSRDPVLVAGVFTAGVKTRMSAKGLDPKTMPVDHAREVLDALAKGDEDIFAGDGAAALRDDIRASPKVLEQRLAERFFTAPLSIE